MSNWFKRLFNTLKEEGEAKKQQSVPKQQATEKPSLEKGNMEAKVAYQYPQGNFRFPVIPDSELSESNKKQQTSSEKRKQLELERERRRRRTEMMYEQQADDEVYEEYVKPKREPKPKTAKPEIAQKKFKRTEVPSPIHGYKKPRPKQEEVELVFNQSTSEGKREEQTDLSLNENASSPEADHQPEVEDVVEKNENAEEHTAETNEQEQVETEVTSTVEEDASQEGEDETTDTDLKVESGEQAKGEQEAAPTLFFEPEQIVERENESDLAVEQEQQIETQTSSLQFVEDEDDEDDKEIEQVAEETSDTSKDTEVEEQDISAKQLNQDIEEEQEKTLEQTEPAPLLNEKAEQSEHEEAEKTSQQPTQNKDPKVKEEKKERPNEQSKKTSVVPFNVLMSKKDRQRWQQRETASAAEQNETQSPSGYTKPQMTLLDIPEQTFEHNDEWLEEQRELLNLTLKNFNVRAKVVNVTCGPAVTRFEVQPEPGVKVSKITNLADDIKLSLAARDIRMEAPIPGKNAIGIEVPNQKSSPVFIREVLRSPAFQLSDSPLTAVLGLDIAGEPMVTDIRKMPHGLIAGATGSGKSVCINSILLSLLYKAAPDEVKLLLIDPKMVELAPYNNVPHLVSPVITDVKAATAALKWAVDEMERRYKLFHHEGVRDIHRFNQKVVNEQQKGEKMPYLVIIIDELADLMMMSPQDVEEAVCRIAQKARACGIHLLLATQRPSVDVITGLIKANIPTRVAFSVSSQVDSRTILDTSGAEKLLGKGDMLFLGNGSAKSVRIQGTFVSDDEIDRVVQHAKKQMKPTYLFEQEELIKQSTVADGEDELFGEACEFVVEQNGASASSLQRRFHIGYNRAARLVELMEARGIVSEQKGSKPRDILISKDQMTELLPDEKTTI
ncbi:DNA translocase FtsK [Bacillus tianshenii]|nr:DNA translocase FtsK [Bacillus tianshenii]